MVHLEPLGPAVFGRRWSIPTSLADSATGCSPRRGDCPHGADLETCLRAMRAATRASTAGSSWPSRPPASTAGRAARRPPRGARTCASTHGRGRPGRRLQGLPALPSRRGAGLTAVEPAGRPRRARHASHRRRRGRPRGRRGARAAGSPTAPATCAGCSSSSSGRAHSTSQSPAGPDRATADRNHRRCPSTTSPSRPALPACDSSTTPSGRSSPSRRQSSGGGRGGAGRPAPPRPPPPEPGSLLLRLPRPRALRRRRPLRFLAARAVPGVEEVAGDTYRRTLRLPHGDGLAELTPRAGHVECRLRLGELRDLGAAVERCRALFDLDADPQAVDAVLGRDPVLGSLVRRRARAGGYRAPSTAPSSPCARSSAQQVSVAAARTVAGRLAPRWGARSPSPGGLLVTFPSAEALAAADPALLPLPATRRAPSWPLPGRSPSGTSS